MLFRSKDFALLESVLLIARVAQSWNLKPAGQTPIPKALVMVRPEGGLPMFIERRN